jgi:GDP-4-dehydro-6-deoxy-D-mannose reductase
MSGEVTLVTGAAGFVGGYLLERLAGWGPLVGWHRPGSPVPRDSPHTTWMAVDITDRAAVFGAIEDSRPARVYHLAGAANVGESWRTSGQHLRANALGTHHLLNAVRLTARPCRVLVVSSALIYRPSDAPLDEGAALGPASPYGFSKLAQDQIALRAAHEDHLDVIVARPFNQIGPRQRSAFALSNFARQLARIEAGLDAAELRVGNLDARRDIIDVRDVVTAYELLMAKGVAGRAYNVCSGRAWRMRDLLDELLRASTATVRVAVDPARLRPTDVPVVRGNATRMREETGWSPVIPVERSVRDMLDWWRGEVQRVAPGVIP